MTKDISKPNKSQEMQRSNLPSLVAISIVAWILVNVLHEIVGHAGLAFFTGLKVKAVNTTTVFVDVNWDDEIAKNGFFRLQLFLAGGVILNFVSWLIGYLVLRFNTSLKPQMRFFIWLFASFSYVVVVMNLISAPLTGGGDLAGIINTFGNKSVAKTFVLVSGLIFMILGYLLLQNVFMPRLKRPYLRTITLIPLAVIIIIQSLSLIKSPFAYLAPDNNHFLVSIFAYVHFLLWALVVIFLPASNSKNASEHIIPEKSSTWVVLGVVVGLFYILIIGPGIGSFFGHPSL